MGVRTIDLACGTNFTSCSVLALPSDFRLAGKQATAVQMRDDEVTVQRVAWSRWCALSRHTCSSQHRSCLLHSWTVEGLVLELRAQRVRTSASAEAVSLLGLS